MTGKHFLRHPPSPVIMSPEGRDVNAAGLVVQHDFSAFPILVFDPQETHP